MKLGQILLRKQLISETALLEILNTKMASKNRLGEVLINRKLITESQLQEALQEQYWRRHGF